MPVIALDTATLVSSVALASSDTLIAEITLQTGKTHSEKLMPHIEQLLSIAGIGKRDLSGVAVSIGPGSFTGLRIGLATAKALAYALQIPLVGVPTLQALAFACPAPGCLISPLLDAQKGNVYQALFQWQNGKLQEVTAARVIALGTLLEELSGRQEPTLFLGEGAVLYRQQIVQCSRLSVAPPHAVISRAGSVAVLGEKLLNQGVRHDVMDLEPLYIRRSEAEELWERRHGVRP